MVANTVAPCFYVGLDQALKQYRLYKYGHSNIKNDIRRQMFAEIFVRFESLMRETNGSMYQYTAMELVLAQPAPSFYMGDTYALQFYYNAMEKKKLKAKRSA